MSARVPVSLRVRPELAAWYRQGRMGRLAECALDEWQRSIRRDLGAERLSPRVAQAIEHGHPDALRVQADVRRSGRWWLMGRTPIEPVVAEARTFALQLWHQCAEPTDERPPASCPVEEYEGVMLVEHDGKVWLDWGGLGDWRTLRLGGSNA